MAVKNKYMVCSNAINWPLKIRVVKTTEEDKKIQIIIKSNTVITVGFTGSSSLE